MAPLQSSARRRIVLLCRLGQGKQYATTWHMHVCLSASLSVCLSVCLWECVWLSIPIVWCLAPPSSMHTHTHTHKHSLAPEHRQDRWACLSLLPPPPPTYILTQTQHGTYSTSHDVDIVCFGLRQMLVMLSNSTVSFTPQRLCTWHISCYTNIQCTGISRVHTSVKQHRLTMRKYVFLWSVLARSAKNCTVLPDAEERGVQHRSLVSFLILLIPAD